jgi:hypothetical protein
MGTRVMETLDKGGVMKRNRKLLCVGLVAALALFCLVSPVDAWNSHGACTKLIISDQGWLKAYDAITVTRWTYEDLDTAAIGPNFVLQYIEGKPGTVTSAAAILTNYADEPDWKMDQDLNLSPFQVLTGGSQGWRHQYYGLGWLRFGVAPSRAQYFFDLAGKAREKGDLYWTSATLRGPCTTCRIPLSHITVFLRPLASSSRVSPTSARSRHQRPTITTTWRSIRVRWLRAAVRCS